jgi:hypothetical protein
MSFSVPQLRNLTKRINCGNFVNEYFIGIWVKFVPVELGIALGVDLKATGE